MKYQLSLALFPAFGFASWPLAIAEFAESNISSDQVETNVGLFFSKISAPSNLRSQTYNDTTNPSLADAPETRSTVLTINGVDVNTTVVSVEGVEVTNTVSSVDGVPVSTTVVSVDGVPVSTTVISNPLIGATIGRNLRSGGLITAFDEQSLQKKDLKIKKKTMSSDAEILAVQADVAILNEKVNKIEGDIKFLNETKAGKTTPTVQP